MELDPDKGDSAIPYLKNALPTYSSTGTFQSKELRSKQQHFDDIPLSQAECQQAWRELACFECPDPDGSFIPSASAKVQAWRSILDQAIASGIDLTAPLSPSKVDLVVDQNEDWPVELSHAVLDSVTTITEGHMAIEETRCIRIIGDNGLAATCQARGCVSVTGFMAAWRDSLPEKWRAGANLDVLPGDRYRLDEDGKDIAYVGDGVEGSSGAPAATKAKSTLGAKRKWHEKFRASKKAA